MPDVAVHRRLMPHLRTCLGLLAIAPSILVFAPIASARQPRAMSKVPTLFLIGDSTVRNGSGDGANSQWGWGDTIPVYFDLITVRNQALGGRSSRTFISEGLWNRVLEAMSPGDIVLMQFGHNDGGPINDNTRARGTIKGTGEETEEIDNLLTGRHEIVHTYGWYLRKYAADTRARGGVPIICSPIPRKIWKDGRIVRDPYARWAEEVARSQQVPLVDLNDIIARRYEAMGPDKVESLFADDHTHTTRAGAELNAACVITGLKALDPNPLAPYFSAKAKTLGLTCGSPSSSQTPPTDSRRPVS
jgi:rhamnogalacturonan acetylesterase